MFPNSQLKNLGLQTDLDLVLHLPLRYEDETRVISIRNASLGNVKMAQIEGVINSCDIQRRPRRELLVTIADDSGQLLLRFLNFYSNQVTQLAIGTRIRARGELRHGFYGAEMIHPAYKVITADTPLPTTLTPVYPSSASLPQAYLRKVIRHALHRMNWSDTLPAPILATMNLCSFEKAIKLLHYPPPDIDQRALAARSHPAWIRIKFDELLAQQLSLKRAQLARCTENAKALTTIGPLSTAFLEQLPFKLTQAQQRVLAEIQHDLALSRPMRRLLQGDVGSGKTVVAALAAAQAIDSGYQAVLMAPTEILAEQHFRSIAAWMEPLGVKVAWLTGSLKKKEKAVIGTSIQSGAARLIIGTHALIQDDVQFDQVGLVIVDEQHRFGVGQRLALHHKAFASNHAAHPIMPHQLMMSATPIPRTLAMTYYADLDISIIDALPPGRLPVITRLINQDRRAQVIERIHTAAEAGQQVYWVCPLIEESETQQLQTATDTHAMLVKALPDLCVGLIHGRLKSAEKQAVMDDFCCGKIHVLVATTVIEVGVDVPNACWMVIEHAERFGLSQLHQLRGRVGRSATHSVCLLLYQNPLHYAAKQRLITMRNTTDGFEIARRDLEIRGPGEFLGARQSGQALLRFANLATDHGLVEKARAVAQTLHQNEPAIVDAHLERWLGRCKDFLQT